MREREEKRREVSSSWYTRGKGRKGSGGNSVVRWPSSSQTNGIGTNEAGSPLIPKREMRMEVVREIIPYTHVPCGVSMRKIDFFKAPRPQFLTRFLIGNDIPRRTSPSGRGAKRGRKGNNTQDRFSSFLSLPFSIPLSELITPLAPNHIIEEIFLFSLSDPNFDVSYVEINRPRFNSFEKPDVVGKKRKKRILGRDSRSYWILLGTPSLRLLHSRFYSHLEKYCSFSQKLRYSSNR